VPKPQHFQVSEQEQHRYSPSSVATEVLADAACTSEERYLDGMVSGLQTDLQIAGSSVEDLRQHHHRHRRCLKANHLAHESSLVPWKLLAGEWGSNQCGSARCVVRAAGAPGVLVLAHVVRALDVPYLRGAVSQAFRALGNLARDHDSAGGKGAALPGRCPAESVLRHEQAGHAVRMGVAGVDHLGLVLDLLGQVGSVQTTG
jgi:hypothetical protein